MIIVTSAIIMNFVSLQVRFSFRNFLEEPSFFFLAKINLHASIASSRRL